MTPPPPPFGDHVRIVATEETSALGYADHDGTVWGFTTPSVSKVSVIGEMDEDYAINVHFETALADAWFARDLVRFIDHAPGTVVKIDDHSWVREPDGSWRQADS